MADHGITPKAEQKPEHSEHWNSLEAAQRSMANLRPWNSQTRPKSPGRPRRSEVETLFRKAGKRVLETDPQQRNMLTLAIESIFRKAARGHIEAMKIVLDRIYGRVRMSDDELPPSTIIVNVRRNVSRFGYEPELMKLPDGKKLPDTT